MFIKNLKISQIFSSTAFPNLFIDCFPKSLHRLLSQIASFHRLLSQMAPFHRLLSPPTCLSIFLHSLSPPPHKREIANIIYFPIPPDIYHRKISVSNRWVPYVGCRIGPSIHNLSFFIVQNILSKLRDQGPGKRLIFMVAKFTKRGQCVAAIFFQVLLAFSKNTLL